MPSQRKKNEKYTEVYIEYYPIVYSVIYSKIRNRDVADDVCQEVFIILFNKFEKVENYRAWLLGTLRFEVLKYFQKQKGGQVNIDEIFEDINLTYVNGFRDTRIAINEAIDEIECDEKDRVMLDLIAKYNFTYGKVAELSGQTRRQVEYRYNQLIAMIMDSLKKKGIDSIGELL